MGLGAWSSGLGWRLRGEASRGTKWRLLILRLDALWEWDERERGFSNLPSRQSHLLVDCASHPPLQLCLGRGRAGTASFLDWQPAPAKSGLNRGARGGAGRAGGGVLTQRFPLAQPPCSFLHSLERVTGRRGWKEGRGKKEERGKRREVWQQQRQAKRPEQTVAKALGPGMSWGWLASRPSGSSGFIHPRQGLGPAALSLSLNSRRPAGPWTEREDKKEDLGGHAVPNRLWSRRPGSKPPLCHLLCDPSKSHNLLNLFPLL